MSKNLRLTAVMAVAGALMCSARAAVIPVEAGGDIAAVVAAAQAGDVVQLAAGEYTLAASISITERVTVRGAGRLLTRIVSDGKSHRLFYLNHADAVLSDVTLANATSGSQGSGVYIEAGTLADAIVCGCKSTAYGGGVAVENGAVRRCVLTGNTTTQGGAGVYPVAGGTPTIENVLAYGNNAQWGGGMYVEAKAKATVVNCTFVDNHQTAPLNGGTGLPGHDVYDYSDTGWMHAVNSYLGILFKNSNAKNSTETMCRTYVSSFGFVARGNHNYRPDARSAMSATGAAVDCTSDLDGAAFTATPSIGAYQAPSSPVFETVTSVAPQGTFDVTVHFPAGAVGEGTLVLFYPDGTTATETVQDGSTVTFTAGGSGVHSLALLATAEDGSIVYRDAVGAVFAGVMEAYVNPQSTNPVPPYATPETAAVKITDPIEYVCEGGTVWLAEGDGYTISSPITVNRAVTIKGLKGRDKTVLVCKGSRLFDLSHPAAVLSGLTLRGTGSASTGIGVTFSAGGGRVEDCIIEDCNCSGTNADGGAIVAGCKACVLERCIVRNNSTARYGGGVYVAANARLDMRDCLFYGNKASGNWGSAVYTDGYGSMVNCTLFNNTISTPGNGQFCRNFATFGVTNTILGSVSWYKGGNADQFFNVGDGSTLADPGFVNAAGGDYRLTATATTLIDLGEDAVTYEGERDVNGEARVQGEHVDIGCCEFVVDAFSASFEIVGTASAVGDSVRLVPTVTGGKNPVNSWRIVEEATGRTKTGTTSGTGDEAAFEVVLDEVGVYSFYYSVVDGTNASESQKLRVFTLRTAGDVYVATAGTPTAPFDTPETALVDLELAARLAPNGATIHLLEGTHELSTRVTISRGVQLAGAGRDKTVVTCAADSRYGLLAIGNKNSVIRDLTLTGRFGKSYSDGDGAGVCITAGQVVDCLMTNLVVNAGANGTAVKISGDRTTRLSRVEICRCSGGQYGTIHAGSCAIDNCFVHDNTVGGKWGAGIYVDGNGSQITVSNCTFAGTQENFVYTMSTVAKFVNCVLDCPSTGNGTQGAANVFHYCASSAGHPIPDVETGVGNLNKVDLGFVDKAGGDYHLTVDSPCRRAGRFGAWMRKARDLDGRKRSAGGRVDIGCYQDSSVGLMLLVK